MRTKAFFSVSRLVVLALTCIFTFCLAACGSDDDEQTVENMLSDKTTPVTFELVAGKYYVFDYSGSRYVGSDTIYEYHGIPTAIYKVDVPLRWGSHHLVWFKGLEGPGYGSSLNVDYSPETKTIDATENGRELEYAECDVNVAEYLLPAQKLEWEPLTASVIINFNNYPFNSYDTSPYPNIPVKYNSPVIIGRVKGFPVVTSASVNSNQYQALPETAEVSIAATATRDGIEYSTRAVNYILCPQEGLAVQLTAEVLDKDGKPMSTTEIPKFPLRRGYTTIAWGPLFPGSPAQWTFTMEPYKE